LGVLKAESEKLKFDTEFLRNCHIAKDLMCACTRNKFRDLEKENQALRERIARLREALTTIASQHRPRHATEEYWNKVSHEQCATVLATDTKIAREALAQDDKVDVK
jgi:hypothetical protein